MTNRDIRRLWCERTGGHRVIRASDALRSQPWKEWRPKYICTRCGWNDGDVSPLDPEFDEIEAEAYKTGNDDMNIRELWCRKGIHLTTESIGWYKWDGGTGAFQDKRCTICGSFIPRIIIDKDRTFST